MTDSDIVIRKYCGGDSGTVAELFFGTVHAVNAADYTREQLFAWAASAEDLTARREDLAAQNTLIAQIGSKVVGFASMDGSGCLDLLFVHKDFQRKGIATALCDEIEKGFPRVKTYASITAKPFFEKRGYKVIKAQEVERRGVKLKNFEMIKIRTEKDS